MFLSKNFCLKTNSICVYPNSVANCFEKVISLRLFNSEKMETRENLETPVRNTKRKNGSEDFKIAKKSRIISRIFFEYQ